MLHFLYIKLFKSHIIYVDFCNNINFEKEEAECDLAFLIMDSETYANLPLIFYQEEKECINQDNSIKQYIHCDRLIIDIMPEA